MGVNLHGMMLIKRSLEAQEAVKMFRDATEKLEQKKKINRNKQKALKRAIMNL